RAHRVGPIGQEIQDYLLQLDPVAVYPRQPLLQLELHRDSPPGHLVPHQHADLAEEVVDVDQQALRGGLLEEAANAGEYRAGSLAILGDVLQCLAHLPEVEAATTEHALDGLRVADDRTERLVDLMGDRGRQFSHQGDAPDMEELLPQTPQLLLG